jgi:wobble nucleotide-excising tRNase
MVLRKLSGTSQVELVDKNPIQTAYATLWEQVKRSSEDPSSASVIGLQNILRRILETYFNLMGGIDNTAIIDKFSGDDQLICRALFSWVNAGSHSIFDDLDYSSSPTTIESNLRVFKRVFELQGQLGHYAMMMGETIDTVAQPTTGSTAT